MEKEEKKTNFTLLRVIVIGVVLVLLVIISIAIVRFVPKALNSLANASLSFGSMFKNSTSTDDVLITDNNTTNTNNGANTNGSGTFVATSTGGFSIRDLTNPNEGNSTISGNTSGIGSANDAGTKNTGSSQNNSYSNTSSNSSSYSSNGNSQVVRSTSGSVGPSDIAVEVLSKGIIDRATGNFVPSNSFTTSDAVIVKFKIENRGTYATGAWTARVNMPTSNSNDSVRVLGPVGSLPAGTAVIGEARFENLLSGNQSVTITVDTTNSTQDTNRSNNSIAVPLSVYGTNVNGGYGYQAGTQADLQIRVQSTGSINQAGQYVPNTSPRYGEKAAVKFEVVNAGGTATAGWSWRADISGSNTSTYYAPAENGLAPGASARFIVGLETNINSNQYNQYDPYTGQRINNYNNYNSYSNQPMYFNIYIDTANSVYESNESNNTASASVTVSQ